MGTVWAFLGAEAKVQFCTVHFKPGEHEVENLPENLQTMSWKIVVKKFIKP